MKEKPLAEQFAEAEAALAEAQRTRDHIRSAYFLSRRERIKAGEEVEPVVCADGEVWQQQLRREQIVRDNAEQDRRAGLIA